MTNDEQSKPLGKNALLGLAKAPPEVRTVRAGGHVVCIRTMTGDERDEWEASMLGPARKGKQQREVVLRGMRAKLAAIVLCDEEGNSFFTIADAQEVGKLPSKLLSAIFDAAQEMNGLGESDIEELVGN